MPILVAACEDGTVLRLDGAGEAVAVGRADGLPTAISGAGDAAVVATDRGEVAVFPLTAACRGGRR
jgi:hypothetical protein